MENEIGQYIKDVKDIPLWLKYVVALSTVFGMIFGGWGIYIILNPAPSTQIGINGQIQNATSTLEISDILTKNQSLQTSYEKQNFLNLYVAKDVVGTGTYDDFFSVDDQSYFALITISSEEVACALRNDNPDLSLKDSLLLLKKGQKVFFSGKFSNTFLNGYYREIGDCILLK